MTTIHARQIQLTKMRVRKTKKVLYIVSNEDGEIVPTLVVFRTSGYTNSQNN